MLASIVIVDNSSMNSKSKLYSNKFTVTNRIHHWICSYYTLNIQRWNQRIYPTSNNNDYMIDNINYLIIYILWLTIYTHISMSTNAKQFMNSHSCTYDKTQQIRMRHLKFFTSDSAVWKIFEWLEALLFTFGAGSQK